MVKTVKLGEGKYTLTAEIVDTGEGLSVTLTGGDKTHVGGIAISTPDGKVEQISLPGHRDVEVAAPMAKRLAEKYRVPVSVVAGIHINNATAEDIEIIKRICNEGELL